MLFTWVVLTSGLFTWAALTNCIVYTGCVDVMCVVYMDWLVVGVMCCSHGLVSGWRHVLIKLPVLTSCVVCMCFVDVPYVVVYIDVKSYICFIYVGVI